MNESIVVRPGLTAADGVKPAREYVLAGAIRGALTVAPELDPHPAKTVSEAKLKSTHPSRVARLPAGT